jgi:Protein of unknown function (DUF3011)
MQWLTRCTVVLSLLGFLCTGFAPRLAAQTSTVRCEARGTSQQTCPIPANSRVELTRTLSQEACREGRNWGVSPGFIWVALGCRAEFAVTSVGYEPGPGNANANPNQLRACRSEADRRLAAYSYDQISVEPDSRQGSVAYVRWWVGPMSGLCAVAANGRLLQFTTNPVGIGGGGTTTRIVCESQRTERQECRIPAGTRIRLLRQTSQNPCRLNDTYGQGAEYIWVAEGCRGEFEVMTAGGGGGGPGSSRVVCASAVNTRRQCPIPPGAQVRLVRQMGEVQCRTSQNWGVGPDFVWVTRGCSGEFEVSGTGGGWQGGNGGGTGIRRIVCESRTAARVQCPVAGATAVRLMKQYSTNPCALDRSFGVGFGHVWVSSGCRGEFEVVTGGTQPGAGGGNGLPDRVVCESMGGQRTECRIRVGGQVRLVRQISTVPCTANNTWGYGYGLIWVTKGCRGEFEVR